MIYSHSSNRSNSSWLLKHVDESCWWKFRNLLCLMNKRLWKDDDQAVEEEQQLNDGSLTFVLKISDFKMFVLVGGERSRAVRRIIVYSPIITKCACVCKNVTVDVATLTCRMTWCPLTFLLTVLLRFGSNVTVLTGLDSVFKL